MNTRTSTPDPDAIILDPATAEIPQDEQAVPLLACVLTARATADNFARIIQYCDRLPDPMWSLTIIRLILHAHPDLQTHAAFCRWAVEHGTVFA